MVAGMERSKARLGKRERGEKAPYADRLGAKCMTLLSFKLQARRSRRCVLSPTFTSVRSLARAPRRI
jgi:hypothetical protein